jgi:hypothetical protein
MGQRLGQQTPISCEVGKGPERDQKGPEDTHSLRGRRKTPVKTIEDTHTLASEGGQSEDEEVNQTALGTPYDG